jgi:hypothetical protein
MRPVAWALCRRGHSGSVTSRTWFGKCPIDDILLPSKPGFPKGSRAFFMPFSYVMYICVERGGNEKEVIQGVVP